MNPRKLGVFAVKKLSLGLCACILGIGAQMPVLAQNWQGLSGGALSPQNIDQGFNSSSGGGGGASGVPGPANTVWTTNSSGTAVGWVLPGSGGTVTSISFNPSLLGGLLSGSVATASTTPVLSLVSAGGLTSHQVLGTFAGTTLTLGSLTAADLPSSTVNTVGNLANLFTAAISGQAIAFTGVTFGGHTFFGNGSGTSAIPTPTSIGTADLPGSVATSIGNAAPLFTASITSQAIGYVLSTFAAHSFYGNNTGITATPTAATIGTGDLPAAVVTTVSNLAPLFTASISGQNLGYVLSTFAPHTFYGNNTGTTATPAAATIGVGDLPAAVVASVGNCATLFTSSVSGQALSFTQSTFGGHTVYGNGTGSTATPGPFTLGTGDLPVSTMFGPQSGGAGTFCNGVNSSGVMTFATPTGGGGGSNFNGEPGGRLTLTTGVPVTSTNITAASTLFYSPYVHDTSYTYTGGLWAPYTFTEYSFAVPAAIFRIYDAFDNGTGVTLTAWDSGGQTTTTVTSITAANPAVVSTTNTFSVGDLVGVQGITGTLGTDAIKGLNGKVCRVSVASGSAVTLEGMDTSALTYTSGGTLYKIPIARTTAVPILQGHRAQTGTNLLYLGTIFVGSGGNASGQTSDADSARDVWNEYHRKPASIQAGETGAWTTTSTTARAANANTTLGAERIEVITGFPEDAIHLTRVAAGTYSAASRALPGIGVNSVTTNSASIFSWSPVATAGAYAPGVGLYEQQPPLGYSFYQAQEAAAGGTLTSIGNNTLAQGGMHGTVNR